MFLAYKYARKKYKERKESQAQPKEASASGPAQPAHGAAVEANRGGTPPVASDAAKVSNLETKVLPVKDTPKTEKEDPIEKARMRKYRWMVVLGLMAPFTLQSLDTTIIAAALPYIASDFGEFLLVSPLAAIPRTTSWQLKRQWYPAS